jgi:RNA polymerase sigma-70 factor (ECF subfamily)
MLRGPQLFVTPGDPVAAVAAVDAQSCELMRRFQHDSSSDAFELLYELNAPRIHRIVSSCLRFAPPDLDSDEITQNVFVSVFRSAGSFRYERDGSFRSWSAQIARNAVRHALRAKRERRELESATALERIAARPQRPEEAEVWHEGEAALPILIAAIAEALDTLLERDRAVLLAADAYGESYEVIGSAMNLRRSTVRMVVFRARRRLFERVEARLFGVNP